MVTGPDSVFVQFKSLNSSDVTIVIYTMVTEPESVFTQSGPDFLRWPGYIFTSERLCTVQLQIKAKKIPFKGLTIPIDDQIRKYPR